MESTPERIRKARTGEDQRLRSIAAAAKGHWGYDERAVRDWAAGNDLLQGQLVSDDLFVADINGEAVAWAAGTQRGDVYWLDDLWVDPRWMGRGIGARLFKRTAEHARHLGVAVMEWEAEPNAMGFYLAMGGRHLRYGEPGVWGRRLEVMRIDLG